MRVLLTGATGFLGSAIATELRSHAHEVIGGVRHCDKFAGRAIRAHLGKKLGITNDFAIDAVIHCAYSLDPDSFELNVEGTKSWFFECRDQGIKTQIFVSSISAVPQATTSYGKSKYVLESFFLEQGGIVVRFGLVVGCGGLFRKLHRVMSILPAVAVPAFPDVSVPISGLDEAVAAIRFVIERIPHLLTNEFNAFNPDQISMRNMAKAVFRSLKKSGLVVPVPTFFFVTLLSMLRHTSNMFASLHSSFIALLEDQNHQWQSPGNGLGFSDRSTDTLIEANLK